VLSYILGIALIVPISFLIPIVAIFVVLRVLKRKKSSNTKIVTPQQTFTTNVNFSGVRADVLIRNVGGNKLSVIKCVRDATGYGLKDAKDIVESGELIKNLPIETAEVLVSMLTRAGAWAEVVDSNDRVNSATETNFALKRNSNFTINPSYRAVRKSVVIKDIDNEKLNVIKCVREVLGCSLTEAKDIVESREPIENLSLETAETLVSKINNTGAWAELL